MNQTFRRLLPVYFVIFFGHIGYSLFITIFTPLFLDPTNEILSIGLQDSQRIILLGVALSLYPFGQFLSSPVLGALSDRFGRRRILLSSLSIACLMYVIIGISVHFHSFTSLLFALFFTGVFEGNIAIAQTVVADIAPQAERSKFFGYIYFSASCAYVLGPIIGGKMVDSRLVSWFSYSTPFFFIGLLFFCILIWISFVMVETHQIHKRVFISWWKAFTNFKNLFVFKELRPIFLGNLLLYLGIFGFLQGFPIYLVKKFDLTVETLAPFITWSSLPFLIVNIWVTGTLAKRFSPTQIVIGSSLFLGLVLEALIFELPLNLWWVLIFLGGFGAALCLPTSVALVSEGVSEKEQGTVVGINQSLQCFSEAFAGLFVGFLASIVLKLPLLTAGIFSIIGALLIKFNRKKR